MATKTQQGTVLSFSPPTGRGRVQLGDGVILPFGATTFRSGRPARYAKRGDAVQAVLESDGSLVAIRLATSS